MNIPKNRKGKVIGCETTKYIGWYIMIECDENDPAGYSILWSSKEDFRSDNAEGYDDWVLNEQELDHFFEYNRLKVDWL